jgi:hypothetical protein
MKLNEILKEGTGYMPGEFDYWTELPGKDETKVRVYYDYQPQEPQSRNYPGCAECVDITSIEGENGTELFDVLKADHALMDQLEQAALEHEIDVRSDDRY